MSVYLFCLLSSAADCVIQSQSLNHNVKSPITLNIIKFYFYIWLWIEKYLVDRSRAFGRLAVFVINTFPFLCIWITTLRLTQYLWLKVQHLYCNFPTFGVSLHFVHHLFPCFPHWLFLLCSCCTFMYITLRSLPSTCLFQFLLYSVWCTSWWQTLSVSIYVCWLPHISVFLYYLIGVAPCMWFKFLHLWMCYGCGYCVPDLYYLKYCEDL